MNRRRDMRLQKKQLFGENQDVIMMSRKQWVSWNSLLIMRLKSFCSFSGFIRFVSKLDILSLKPERLFFCWLRKKTGMLSYSLSHSSPLPCFGTVAFTSLAYRAWVHVNRAETTFSSKLRHGLRNMPKHGTLVFTLVKWTGLWGQACSDLGPGP